MSKKRSGFAALFIGLLYVGLFAFYILSLVVAFLAGGVLGLLLWMMLVPDLLRCLEKGVQFIEDKLDSGRS